jgi:superfamily II DNA or RNA helicase
MNYNLNKNNVNNFNYQEWFQKRGLSVRPYQMSALNDLEAIFTNELPTVLAASPSSGKTNMSIAFIERYLDENPTHKILVLTHGTTILRTQFYKECKKLNPNFSYSKILNKNDVQHFNDSVAIAIPQTLKCLSGKFDLVVVDEAHHFYQSQSVQKLIKAIDPKNQLLLTGTPSPFVLVGYPIIYVPLQVLIKNNNVSDLKIELVKGESNCEIKDFNVSNDLKDSYKFKVTEIQKTLENLIFRIIENSNQGMIGKTLIACKNTDQANIVYKYLKDKNIKTELSTSEIDKDSEAIRYFEEDSSCQILVVVYRGVLGFNMPELVNVIDFTFSQNIDRIFQLMARVFRKSDSVKTKYFYKVSPISLEFFYQHIMNATLSLSQIEYLSLYNGKNFSEMPVVHKVDNIKVFTSKKNNQKRKVPVPIIFTELAGLEVFESLKSDNTIYATTQIGEIKSKIFNNNVIRTDRDIIKSGKGFNNYKEWAAANKTYVTPAHQNSLLVVMREMYNWSGSVKNKSKYYISDIYDSAKQYSEKQKWRGGCTSIHQSAQSNKYLTAIDWIMDWKDENQSTVNIIEMLIIEKTRSLGSIEALKQFEPKLFKAAQMFNLINKLI